MKKALLAVAAVAAIVVSGVTYDRTQAAPIGLSTDMRNAIDSAAPVTDVRWCEYLDPVRGRWVEFWVDGPCLRLGAAGYDGWLTRWYRHDRARWRWHASRH